MLKYLLDITEKVLSSEHISFEDAGKILKISNQRDIISLLSFANIIRDEFKGSTIDTCAIVNAKSGKCSEDCKFCSQSAHNRADIERYPLVEKKVIIDSARDAVNIKADRIGIVVSGRDVKNTDELKSICNALEDISSNVDIAGCASLGTLSYESAKILKESGLKRYHHNLETAESFFPEICTTHSYEERIKTVKIAKEAGFEVCCGGIFGIGETPQQRLEFAFTLKELDVDSIPLNFLNPITGTPLENAPAIPPMEILKIIAMFRFVHPTKDIRVCGGRQTNLRGVQPLMYIAGANGIMIGNYLTTAGGDPNEDLQLIEDLMLSIR